MSCCGDLVAKPAGILAGYVMAGTDKLYQLPRPKYDYADIRLATCRMCEDSTWLSFSDYFAFLRSHKIAFVKNLNDLSVLPKLDKKDHQKEKRLFCRICKCWLPAKSYIKDEKCPLNKWDK